MRSFVQLAKVYSTKSNIGDWYCSEKLDGMRAVWLPGTGGMNVREIPFANIEKNSRYKHEIFSTGLWSRYGNVIHAPSSFIDNLPDFPLDGELYIKRKSWQRLISIVKDLTPGPGWEEVKFIAFDSPKACEIMFPGTINDTNFKKLITHSMQDWLQDKLSRELKLASYEHTLSFLRKEYKDTMVQSKIPYMGSHDFVRDRLAEVIKGDGEGLILRHPTASWEAKRTGNVLKVKSELDSEGIVVRENEGVGKYFGMMGSLTIRWGSILFDLSGFTDIERTPGYFKPGDVVTFIYRELSDEGKPKEARYLRKN
jgi:DNA ligase-1